MSCQVGVIFLRRSVKLLFSFSIFGSVNEFSQAREHLEKSACDQELAF